MRPIRAVSTALASALTLALAVSLGASAPSYADPARPELPAQASDRAEEALALVEDLLAGRDRGVELTTAFRELFKVRDQLEGEDRERAYEIMARPDGESPSGDMDANWDHLWNASQEARPVCNSRVCVHYVTSGKHAATYAEADSTLKAMTRSWKREIGDLGFRAPRKDGTRGDRRWADSKGKLDVYLADLYDMGAYGYAMPESEPASTDDGKSSTTTGYMVLDQDYEGYGPTPGRYRKVTAAHELFHLIQYAYDVNEARWFMESTATWVEERVFDGINDNRNYLEHGQLGNPTDTLSLTNGAAEYGNWLLHEFYTQRKGNRVVQRAWYYASRGKGWRAALAASLNRSGWSWPAMYTAYAANNNFPAHTYEEGRAYREAAATPTRRKATSQSESTLQPHSAASFRFFPGYDGGLLSGDTSTPLTLAVNLQPGINHRAYVIVQFDGRVARYLIRLDANGDGVRSFPFAEGDVRHVTLTLVNASTSSQDAGFRASNG